MRARSLCLGFLCLIYCVPSAHAVDLTKIDRVPAKEPNYRGKPKYCLLVFGPEAKFRVWLVLDGDVLYMDKNGNGDLTEPAKRVSANYKKGDFLVFRPGKLDMPDSKPKCDLSQLRKMPDDEFDMSIRLEDGRWTRAGFDGPGKLRFADRARDAPIIHFLGALTLQRFEPQAGSVSAHLKPEPLARGRETKLAFSLGTPGLGGGTFAKYDLEAPRKRQDRRPGPPDASAEIRFPNGKVIQTWLAPDL